MEWIERIFSDQYVFSLVTFFNAITFYIVAWATEKWPPKYPSKTYGYRTKRSYKSQAHWDYAQEKSKDCSLQLAHVFLIAALIGYFVPMNVAMGMTLMFVVMAAGIAWMFFNVEQGLKDNFPE